MGTTDKSDKPNKDQVDRTDSEDQDVDVVEDAHVVEEPPADEAASDDSASAPEEDVPATPEATEDGSADSEESVAETTDDDDATQDAADAIETVDEVSPPPAETATASASEATPRKGGFVPLVLGGVIAAGLGFGSAVYLGDQLGLGAETNTAIADLTAKLDAQSDVLATLQEKQDASVNAAQALADTSAAETGQLQDQLAQLSADLQQAAEAVATFEARLTDIEKRPLNEGLGAAAIAAYEREVKDLKELVAAQKAEAAELKDRADLSAKAALGRSAVSRIVAALESGAPYRAALVNLQSSSGTTVAQVLEDHADTGVITLAALIESYPEAARGALAKAREDNVDAENGSRLGNFLKTQFGARSVEAREGTDTDAVLSRAEAALKAGDLAMALGELDALAEGPKTVMADWIAQAQTRLSATQAAEDLAQTLNSN